MSTSVETAEDRHRPQKSWGHEEWIVNNEFYCGKRLHFEHRGGSTSLHYHAVKHETMYVEHGIFDILVVDTRDGSRTTHRLYQGESLVIRPNTPHRIVAARDKAVLVEFSTHHEDSDSYRIEL